MLKEKANIPRDLLMDRLLKDGIETRPLFYPMHQMPVYLDSSVKCPICEKLAAHGINLPTHDLLTREDVSYICGRLKYYIG